jgi:hypothetical protein
MENAVSETIKFPTDLFELQVKTQVTLEKLKSVLAEDNKSRLKDEQQIMMLELKIRSELVLKKLKNELQRNRVIGF